MKLAPVLVLVAGLTSASSALAHAHLKAEPPAADGVLPASPSTLSLDFSEGLEIGISGVILKGQDGRVVPTGAAVLTPDGGKKISGPLNGGRGAGNFTGAGHPDAAE